MDPYGECIIRRICVFMIMCVGECVCVSIPMLRWYQCSGIICYCMLIRVRVYITKAHTFHVLIYLNISHPIQTQCQSNKPHKPNQIRISMLLSVAIIFGAFSVFSFSRRHTIGCCFVTFFTRKAALNAQDAMHNVKTLVGVSTTKSNLIPTNIHTYTMGNHSCLC